MHAISSASPSHVAVRGHLYDVVCWTVSDGGKPTPWFINSNGELTRFKDEYVGWELRPGLAPKADA